MASLVPFALGPGAPLRAAVLELLRAGRPPDQHGGRGLGATPLPTSTLVRRHPGPLAGGRARHARPAAEEPDWKRRPACPERLEVARPARPGALRRPHPGSFIERRSTASSGISACRTPSSASGWPTSCRRARALLAETELPAARGQKSVEVRLVWANKRDVWPMRILHAAAPDLASPSGTIGRRGSLRADAPRRVDGPCGKRAVPRPLPSSPPLGGAAIPRGPGQREPMRAQP